MVLIEEHECCDDSKWTIASTQTIKLGPNLDPVAISPGTQLTLGERKINNVKSQD